MDALVDRVYEAICNHQINSPFFTTILCRESDIRHSYADHFAQLLFEFAASGQDLHIFDANSEYIRLLIFIDLCISVIVLWGYGGELI